MTTGKYKYVLCLMLTDTSQSSQPPDVTSTAQSRRIAPADRLNRLNQKRSQSSVDETSGKLCSLFFSVP